MAYRSRRSSGRRGGRRSYSGGYRTSSRRRASSRGRSAPQRIVIQVAQPAAPAFEPPAGFKTVPLRKAVL